MKKCLWKNKKRALRLNDYELYICVIASSISREIGLPVSDFSPSSLLISARGSDIFNASRPLAASSGSPNAAAYSLAGKCCSAHSMAAIGPSGAMLSPREYELLAPPCPNKKYLPDFVRYNASLQKSRSVLLQLLDQYPICFAVSVLYSAPSIIFFILNPFCPD